MGRRPPDPDERHVDARQADDRWARVCDAFAAALERPPAERAAVLDALNDASLRAEVESLLDSHTGAAAHFGALAGAAAPLLAALNPAAVDASAPSNADAPRSESEPAWQAGDRVGPYHVEAPLGAGGMGTVYRACDTRLGRRVALKRLRLAGDEARAWLLREARAIAALDHPHVCAVYDVEADAEAPYLAMAYYEGETLQRRLRRGPLPLAAALGIAAQIADGLAAAHAAGIVHRDLKPGNVMLVADPNAPAPLPEASASEGVPPDTAAPPETSAEAAPYVRLLDFGVARHTRAARLTRTGATPGTLAYMAPEQIRGEAVDGRADLWALGVLLYEMLGGARPFARENDAARLYAILHDLPEPLDGVPERVPEPVAALVDALLQKDPAARPASAAAVRGRLEALLSGPPPAPETASPPPSRPTRRGVGGGHRWIAAALLAAAVVAGLGWAALRPAAPPRADAMTVAVLPFAVRSGPDLRYLREGLVDLLATQLDGVAGLRSVDPNALLSQAGDGPLDLAAARALAQRFEAGHFVLGRAVDTGGGLRLHASLYRADGTEEARAAATADSMGALLGALDALARQLVAAQLDDPDQQLASLAALTTGSFPALRAYLDGERLLRAARFEEAERSLTDAVGADSTFALAWYRLARASGWTGHAALNRRAVAQALRHAEALPPRVRLALAGYQAFRAGRPDRAEAAYRAVLARHPDDAETWYLLGEALFHFNPYAGRPTAEAEAPLRRAFALAPGNRELLVHLMDFAARRGDDAALDTLAARYLAADPPALAASYRALRDWRLGDAAAQNDALARLQRAGSEAVEHALTRPAALSGDRAFVRALAALLADADAPDVRARGLVYAALLAAGAGDWEAAAARFREARALDAGAVLHEALAAAGPDAPAAEVRAAHAAVLAWEPAAADAPVRTYLLGLLRLRLGDADAASEAAVRLDGMAAEGLTARLAATLRAALALDAGRPDEALGHLDRAPVVAPFAQRLASPLYDEPLARLLRAQALAALGRDADAARWAATLRDGYALWGAPYRQAADALQAL